MADRERLQIPVRPPGIDWLCDYTAKLIDDDRIVDNPARRRRIPPSKPLRLASPTPSGTSRSYWHRADSAAQKNKAIPAAQDTITRAQQAVAAARAARDAIPARSP